MSNDLQDEIESVSHDDRARFEIGGHFYSTLLDMERVVHGNAHPDDWSPHPAFFNMVVHAAVCESDQSCNDFNYAALRLADEDTLCGQRVVLRECLSIANERVRAIYRLLEERTTPC